MASEVLELSREDWRLLLQVVSMESFFGVAEQERLLSIRDRISDFVESLDRSAVAEGGS